MPLNRLVMLTRGGIIAALYVALTLTPPLNTISYGPIQFRISEALNVLAYFEPAAIPGLFIGCIIANLGSPFGTFDIITGSLYTLASAYLIWKSRKPAVALLAPVIINGLGVGFTLYLFTNINYAAAAAYVAAGEALVIYGLGYPLLMALLKRKVLIRDDAFSQKMDDSSIHD